MVLVVLQQLPVRSEKRLHLPLPYAISDREHGDDDGDGVEITCQSRSFHSDDDDDTTCSANSCKENMSSSARTTCTARTTPTTYIPMDSATSTSTSTSTQRLRLENTEQMNGAKDDAWKFKSDLHHQHQDQASHSTTTKHFKALEMNSSRDDDDHDGSAISAKRLAEADDNLAEDYDDDDYDDAPLKDSIMTVREEDAFNRLYRNAEVSSRLPLWEKQVMGIDIDIDIHTNTDNDMAKEQDEPLRDITPPRENPLFDRNTNADTDTDTDNDMAKEQDEPLRDVKSPRETPRENPFERLYRKALERASRLSSLRNQSDEMKMEDARKQTYTYPHTYPKASCSTKEKAYIPSLMKTHSFSVSTDLGALSSTDSESGTLLSSYLAASLSTDSIDEVTKHVLYPTPTDEVKGVQVREESPKMTHAPANLTKALRIISQRGDGSISDEQLAEAFVEIVEADFIDKPLQDAIMAVKEDAFHRLYRKAIERSSRLSLLQKKAMEIQNSSSSDAVPMLKDLSQSSSAEEESAQNSEKATMKRFDPSRLYNSRQAQKRQMAGKERRKEIEKAIAQRHQMPDFSKKISLSRANEIYYKSLERVQKTDERKIALAKELDVTYQPRYRFKDP